MAWEIHRVIDADKDKVQTYWQTLYMEGGLEKRLCNIPEPTWSDVVDLIRNQGQWMFMVWDHGRQEYTGEFLLEAFTGKAAMIHVSTHPKNTLPYSLEIGIGCSDQMLRHGFSALYGITPMTNRAACIYALKCGFRKVAVLPQGILDRGVYADAMISIKSEITHGR